jgi:hypothetical protein
MRTVRFLPAGAVLFAAILASATDAPAQPQTGSQRASELSAQSRPLPRRARTRIQVHPRRPSSVHPIYPRLEPAAYPGPNAVRECTSWLEPEHRPSGTVIVPRLRCWWVTARTAR